MRENIASFGGNPNKITIDGCSAGVIPLPNQRLALPLIYNLLEAPPRPLSRTLTLTHLHLHLHLHLHTHTHTHTHSHLHRSHYRQYFALYIPHDVSPAGRAGRTGSAMKGEAILMLDEKEFGRQRQQLLTEALPAVRSCLCDVSE